jgi:8-oxo-dGTP pyrophosphatase MutT (NUDIX family)
MARAASVGNNKESWTVLDRAVLYSNPWITVREDRVRQPDGEEAAWGIVEMKPGVSVLPIDDAGNVYLVRVFRYTMGRDSIEAIAGGIDDGEEAVECARRELKEEAGIEATEMLPLGQTDQLTEVVVSPNWLFLARGLTFREDEREPTEQIRVIKAPLDRAVSWTMDGTITHAASLALILKAARLIAGENSPIGQS